MRLLCFLTVLGLALSTPALAQPPAGKLQVITPKDDGIIATGINGRGEIVGFEWIEEKARPGVLEQTPFFAKGKDITYLPLLKGYTATFPAAVSDDGMVVGRSGKPAPPGVAVPLRNQAFLWDAKSGIRGLGTLPDDTASFASGITRDGRRISGFSVGTNRVRACVWDREGDAWKATALPQKDRLGSNTVPISDDGNFVAAVDGEVPCLWSRASSGEWTRKVISASASLVPRAVNNAGTVVGVKFTNDGDSHAVIWTSDDGYLELDKPKGYTRSEANAVNNAGAIVGMVDGPRGSKIGPNAFIYEKGRLRVLDEGGPNFTSATAINDHGQVAGVLEKPEDDAPAAAPNEKPK
jgi:uncharacterized membrane protein